MEAKDEQEGFLGVPAPDDNATVVPKKCMSAPLGENKDIWSRCTMSRSRIFSFYGDSTWSLDSSSIAKTYNQGKLEYKGDEYEFCSMGMGDEIFFNDYVGGNLRVFNPETGQENKAWGQQVPTEMALKKKKDWSEDEKQLNIIVQYVKNGEKDQVLVIEESAANKQKTVVCTIYESGNSKPVYQLGKSFTVDNDGDEVKVFYVDENTVYLSKQFFHFFENKQPLKYFLWKFGDKDAKEFSFDLKLSVYVEGACLDQGNVSIFCNHLIPLDKPDDPWVPRVYIHNLQTNKADCLPLGTLDKKSKDYCSFMVLKVIGQKNGTAVYTVMGTKTNENLVAYNLRQRKVQRATVYWDKPQPGFYNMVDPTMTQILHVTEPHASEKYKCKEGEQKTDMYVYRYYLRTEPEYWSLHYMLLSGIKEGIDTHLISEVIKMQYGDDVTHKEV